MPQNAPIGKQAAIQEACSKVIGCLRWVSSDFKYNNAGETHPVAQPCVKLIKFTEDKCLIDKQL